MECKAKENKKGCTCSYEPCSRKGVCCDCVSYHRQNGELPGCFFPESFERTCDRSVKNFLEAHRN